MNNKKTKKVTIADLAKMIKENVVDRMATKEDIKDMATKTDIEELKDKINGTNKRIDDFAETKVSKITYKELENRVGFIEKKLEIKK